MAIVKRIYWFKDGESVGISLHKNEENAELFKAEPTGVPEGSLPVDWVDVEVEHPVYGELKLVSGIFYPGSERITL